MRVVDGRAIAAALATEVHEGVQELVTQGVVPTLVVVVATQDGASASYVRSIVRTAERVGITCRVDTLDQPDAARLKAHVEMLSSDDRVHGVMVQTPLPAGIAVRDVGSCIAPSKDVDGANPASMGRLLEGTAFAPATAAAVLEVLARERVPLAGRRVVVVGRSDVVGLPVSLLLLAQHATVTVCHSRTVDLPAECARADVLVVAAGRAGLVGAEHVGDGAVVIDVGTNVDADGTLVGDVSPEGAARASAATPVPGGVGPVTSITLMAHTLAAARAAASRT